MREPTPAFQRKPHSKKIFFHSSNYRRFHATGRSLVVLRTQRTFSCYESLLPEHSENAFKSGVEIYLASVAKSANGVIKAFKHYPAIAKKYSMIVLMSNCIGKCGGFESAGKSAIWNKKGELVGQLNEKSEGILVFDTGTEEIIEWTE